MSNQITVPDVSRWQGNIDWAALRTQFEAVIIKVSGADGGLYTDNNFIRNRDNARANGFAIWYYHFKGNAGSAQEQANYMINAIGGLQAGEGIMLDDENEAQINTAFGVAFNNQIKSLVNINQVLYSNLARFKGDVSAIANANVGCIVAKYGVNDGTVKGAGDAPAPAGVTTIGWQYTSAARVAGITANTCDLSLFYGDVAAFRAYGTPGNVPPRNVPAPAPATGNGTYTVVSGDTLSGIGSKVGIAWQTIAATNGIVAPYTIYPGEVLKVYGGTPGQSQVTTADYVVVSGDTLSGIGAKTGHNWQDIAKLNNIGAPYTIYPGQHLALPGGSVAPAAQTQPTYTVRSGDNLSVIGDRTGVAWKTIASLNGISAPYTIYPGQVLRLA